MNLNLPDDSTPDTASTWLRQLVREFGGGFHLDTRAEDYTRDDGEQVFTGPESDILESSIDKLFAILGDELPYEIGADEAYAIQAESRGMRPPFENHDPEHQQRLLREGTRTELIDWLSWNDPNGVWTDEDSASEGKAPLTVADAREWMAKAVMELV